MIRIAIVDDHPVVRAGLRMFLEAQAGFEVVAEAASGVELLDVLRRAVLDLVMLDLSLAGGGGIEVLGAIKARAPRLPVLVFSGYPAALYAETVLRLGAAAFLNKACDPDEITALIRRLCAVAASVGARCTDSLAPRDDDRDGQGFCGNSDAADAEPHHRLNAREFQIFLRLAKGEAIGTIGASLALSPATVSVYRSRLMRKFALGTNAELTGYALRRGLL